MCQVKQKEGIIINSVVVQRTNLITFASLERRHIAGCFNKCIVVVKNGTERFNEIFIDVLLQQLHWKLGKFNECWIPGGQVHF